MNRDPFVTLLGRRRALAILRSSLEGAAAPAMEAAVSAGFRILEFTLNTPGALDRIREFSARDGLVVGAGTVLDPEDARRAIEAGAAFLVSPVVDEAVIDEGHAAGVAVIPGAQTPTELLRAHRAGAPLQKLFPRETVRRSQHDFRHEGRRKPFLFRLWPYLVYLDCLALYLVIKPRNRRKIMLMDRYFYHHAIGYEYHGYSNRLVRWLFFSLPRPHVAIILDAPAEIAYERKKTDDAGLEYYQAQRQRYLELADHLGITTVSTDQPFASSLSAVWAQVTKALPGRLPEETA